MFTIKQAPRALALFACTFCTTGLMTAAHAQLRPMSEEDLSQVHGKGLVEMSNTSYGGFDFSRAALDADITLSANIRNTRLGEYTVTGRNGLGADIDMPLLQFGRSDGADANRLVHISNPYIEFVYKSGNDGKPREVVGMRIGFDAISGDVGIKLNTLSGSMRVTGTAADGSTIAMDTRTDVAGFGKRWDGACTGSCLQMSQVGAVTAGDASGPSRDFWISMLKTGVQFAPGANGQAPDMAQAGVWLNWRDKLTALTTNGVTPPNLPKGR
ncbi:hypothetical protein GCM10027277_55890 [Pseudoduganella ginsengisoli]|uniref:Porin n=1 Tax=Pseudoduganella ginsengisoli TaxID=1462440 RepID=A0A6L6Q636_9BURK|nr:hypothetical protein [Pseudoduganella ginsengisoli]MTW05025.1 hypothetical protein [Pseudoduganella ginsengisoli]